MRAGTRILGRVVFVLGGRYLPPLNDRFETLAKVDHAPDGIDNGDDEQQHRDDSEEGQASARRQVVQPPVVGRVVHAHQLEEEIGHRGEVEHDNDEHSEARFVARPVARHYQDADGDWNCSDGQPCLCVGRFDHDEELNCEAEEEKEIELQKRDVDLGGKELVSHSLGKSGSCVR